MTAKKHSEQFKNLSQVLSPKQIIIQYPNNIIYYKQEVIALTNRLFIQTLRRPSMLITGILQPLLWLLLFGALFQNAPIEIFTTSKQYGHFISSGIIVFTSFTGSLNAGLPLMFDREFGFLNRILSSPLESRLSIVTSASSHITLMTFVQVTIIILTCFTMGNEVKSINNMLLVCIILTLLTNSITSLSIILAFTLPGHIELLALLLTINLPLLFSSTALAPLVFMPAWLQIIASLNPLSYAIESIRYSYISSVWNMQSIILDTVWGKVHLQEVLYILISLNILSFLLVKKIISSKFEE